MYYNKPLDQSMKLVYFVFNFTIYYLKSLLYILWMFEIGSFKKLFLYQHSSNHQDLKSKESPFYSFLITISNLLQNTVQWLKNLTLEFIPDAVITCIVLKTLFHLVKPLFFSPTNGTLNTISQDLCEYLMRQYFYYC